MILLKPGLDGITLMWRALWVQPNPHSLMALTDIFLYGWKGTQTGLAGFEGCVTLAFRRTCKYYGSWTNIQRWALISEEKIGSDTFVLIQIRLLFIDCRWRWSSNFLWRGLVIVPHTGWVSLEYVRACGNDAVWCFPPAESEALLSVFCPETKSKRIEAVFGSGILRGPSYFDSHNIFQFKWDIKRILMFGLHSEALVILTAPSRENSAFSVQNLKGNLSFSWLIADDLHWSIPDGHLITCRDFKSQD